MQIAQDNQLLTVADADAMSEEENLRLFKKHIGHNLGKMLSMLGFADTIPVRAEGMHITMNDGRDILDMTGHVGVLVAGHNHPRIIEARRKWGERQGLETWKFFPSPYQGALCHNLSLLFPEDLEIVFFCNSGAEANEGAMKLAQKYAGQDRKLVAYTDISFHGKTHATLTVSGSEQHQNHHFNKLENCHMVKYGDIGELRQLVESNVDRKGVSKVGTFIVEAIRTEGVVKPDSLYFRQVRELCDQYDIVLIFDEIYTGFGRTGKMFAFEHHGVCPDICTFSKAFGGGKATFAAFITRPTIYNKAYAKMNEATLHSTTYNGYGEEIVTSLEVLNIIQDERLVDNSAEVGGYLLQRLQEVQREYPELVADVRGVGLLCCIKFKSKTEKLLRMVSGTGSEAMEKFITGAIITKLFQDHNILTFTPPHDAAQLLVTPSLIIRKEHVDQFVEALKQVLGSNLWTVGFSYMKKLKG